MAKKKATSKKKSSRKKTKDEPMSKGFGHLTILPNWIVRGDATVDGGERQIDSMECWDGCEWDEE
jgi:hypothetical protein